MRLKNKVFVITGGASGIGRACAIRYAQEGGKVVIADINAAGGQDTASYIRESGGEAVFQQTDVSETTQLDRLLQRALDEFDGLHVWHNNAFTSVFKNIVDQTLQEFDDTVRVSLRAYWYGSKIAVTHMLNAEGGLIINTASVQSYFGEPGFSAYQVAKGGILSLTRSIGVDHAPKVRAVALAPGFIITPAHDGIPPETIERVKASIPAKRGAQPEEVAALAAFLASDEADYITATGIIQDGGYLGI
jgi:NAD(P)-dependent dehydrogenase (short-subunit alcohol dehydrogenase family)